MGQFDGRVVVITGAGRGIGREHALLFASLGAQVVVNDLGSATDGTGDDPSAAQTVVDEIVAAGGTAVASTDSVAAFEGARRIIDTALESFGDLHVVVNNAGITRERPLIGTTQSDFDDVVQVNLNGTFYLIRHAAGYWRSVVDGGTTVARAIVNTSSGAGLHGSGSASAYAAAKAGVAALTIVAAGELTELGVRVNAIAPIARTRMAVLSEVGAALFEPPSFDPSHISPLVAVLAAPDCPFTGQVFSVCGPSIGIYAGWSIAEEIRAEERWTFESLHASITDLPASVQVRGQSEVFASFIGGAWG